MNRKHVTWDDKTRKKIRLGANMYIRQLQKCAKGEIELSMAQLRSIEILLRKCIPDLTSITVNADITHRYVMQLPDVLDKETWLKKYGDPRQIEGPVNGKADTLQ